MNIKPCVKCGKPLRADATYCKACGHTIGGEDTINRPSTAHTTRRSGRTPSRPYYSKGPSRNRDTRRTGTRPTIPSAQKSIPPASPHRAGHYSGLHPEDQPYQSSFIAALRPPTPAILSPSPLTYPLERVIAPTNPNATWTPESERHALDSQNNLSHEEDREQDEPLPPPAPLPASSYPNAIWTPEAKRAREEKAILPRLDTPPVPYREEKEPEPLAFPKSTRNVHLQSQRAPSFSSDPDLADFPQRMQRTSRMQERAVPLLLTISCLFFLVATSLLAYVFLSKHTPVTKSTLTAMPNSGLRVGDTFLLAGTGFGSKDLVTFTRDKNIPLLDSNHTALQEHTDAAGNFSVQVQVAPNWAVGQHTIYVVDNVQLISAAAYISVEAPSPASPQLQLKPSRTTLDFGAGDQGTISKQRITLTNAGGGQLTWMARSDASWLSVTPNDGTFGGSEVVELIVNRSAQPGAYTGHVTFIQQNCSGTPCGRQVLPLTLTVSMSINAAPLPAANLLLSTASLTYAGSTTQNPAPQSLTLQNTGGQPLNWSATTTTGDGAPWLSMTPSSGTLPAGTATPVTVNVQTGNLAVGSYTGTISFQGGANPQVVVTLTIVAPPNLALSTTALPLSASQGQEASGGITLSNSGGEPLDWTATSSAAWLNISSAQGHLDPAESRSITVTANAAALSATVYSGTLTFSYGTTTKSVAVNLTVSVPPMAGISVQPASLTFNTTQGINPSAQTFTITNIGNATLDWATTEDANGTAYAATSASSPTSSLAPAKNITITVTPKVASANPGTITALVTVYDRDPGSTVPKQQVTITITITPAAIITATPANMLFTEGNGVTSEEELLSIENTGSAPLNWSLAQGSQTPAPWLSFDTPNGSIAPGTTITVNVTCDSSQLSPGTYTATLVVSDSDPNSPVLSQTVTITLVVS